MIQRRRYYHNVYPAIVLQSPLNQCLAGLFVYKIPGYSEDRTLPHGFETFAGQENRRHPPADLDESPDTGSPIP